MSLIFAFETSCDETACALFDGGRRRLVGERVRSQAARHADYDGVVPELAARDHLAAVLVLADDLLTASGTAAADIGCVAYTRGPGLAAALLAGAATAQGLAAAWGVATVAVNHLEGHILSPLLARADLAFPYLCLLVSGGHTQLWRVDGFGQYARLGQTLDDAAGEAFDKSAVLLGLGYPGGAKLETLANSYATGTGGGDYVGDADTKPPPPAQGNLKVLANGGGGGIAGGDGTDIKPPPPAQGNCKVLANSRGGADGGDGGGDKIKLPSPAKGNLKVLADGGVGGIDIKLPSPAQGDFDFSFSGLKTAVKRAAGKYEAAALAAAFQRTVAVGLAKQAQKAMRATGIRTLTAVGGVAINNTVAQHLNDCAQTQGGVFIRPAPQHCSDNAAMIALAAAHQTPHPPGPFTITPRHQPTQPDS